MIRRNQVVAFKDTGGLYCRVWRVISPDYVLIITAGRHIKLCHPDDLEVHDYHGYWETRYHHSPAMQTVWVPMPSLRRLKQTASMYVGGTMWKKKRPKWKLLPRHTQPSGRYGNMLKEYMVPTDL